jgi:predicted sugar kinase
VLPTQTSQVYYTRSPGRKRVRPPTDWQVVIHIPSRTRAQPTENEVYQEDILRSPTPIRVEPVDDINLVHSGVEGVEVDRDLLNVPDVVQLFSEVESESEEDGEADDGYDSPVPNENDDTSNNEEE